MDQERITGDPPGQSMAIEMCAAILRQLSTINYQINLVYTNLRPECTSTTPRQLAGIG